MLLQTDASSSRELWERLDCLLRSPESSQPHTTSTEPEAGECSGWKKAPFAGGWRVQQQHGATARRRWEALHRSCGVSGSKQVLWKCCQQFIIPTILLATGLSFGPSFQGSDFEPKPQVRTRRAKAGQTIGSFHSSPPFHGGGRRAGGYREAPPRRHALCLTPQPDSTRPVLPFQTTSIISSAPCLSSIAFFG